MYRPSWQTHSRPLAAYTLLEISISLVVIGLIAGAVIVGQVFIQQGNIRLVTRELARHEAAYTTFRDKYDALPGDMDRAHTIWGTADGNGSNVACQEKQTFDGKTCSGNGNGVIMTSQREQDETHRAWQHLKNAGLIEGTFGGTTNNVAAGNLLTVTVAASRAQGAGYQFFYESKVAQGWTNAPEAGGAIQAIRVAAPYSGADAPVRLGNRAFSPYDTASIDEKIDDAKPGLGKVFVHYLSTVDAAGNSSCVTSGDALTADYQRAVETIGCYFHYDLTK